jgi:hypothetical protein
MVAGSTDKMRKPMNDRTSQGSSPVTVTAESVDPVYNEPYIEIDELRRAPVPHRYVHGGFKGTDARFSFYFPPPEQYQGRFFHNTYPMAVVADIGPFPIAFEVATGDLPFTLDSGAYYVQTNNGGMFRAANVDPAIAAYRVNAAAAKYSRIVAAQVFGEHRPFGYLFGGSGGAYQTMGAAENTSGVWDGFLPFVPGCNHAIPSMFTVRMHALRELRRRNRLPGIADALEPGGSGDPYAELNEQEAKALREVSLMGYPLKGWYCHETLDSGYFANISGMIPAMDPGYAEDFWTKPGYLGGDPASAIHAERFRFATTVAAIDTGAPVRIELAQAPGLDAANAHLVVESGAATGASLPIAHASGTAVTLIAYLDPALIASIQPGDRVRVDNSWALALETYHRHQVPPGRSYYAWNQFRDASGEPVPPQRDVLVGPFGTANAAGAPLTGDIHGKVLVLACLMDIDAFPWQADWYKELVRATRGERFADDFVLWFIENAHHENPMTPLARAHVVSYGPALKQGLRDLAAWVETGERPRDTVYHIADTQVAVPATASERNSVQPVVSLTANGLSCAKAAAGEPVRLSGVIEVPPYAGKVVAAEWDFEGAGEFADTAEIPRPAARVEVTAAHAYATPGTYFAVLRGTSQRQGDTKALHCRIQNLARVRVIVG